MLRSPFRRARPTERDAERAEHEAAARAAPLPDAIAASLRTALSADAPVSARVAAIGRLEHVRAPAADAVARALVAALDAPPDVAARAHLALLVLAPRLALARGTGGGFVASERTIDDVIDEGGARVDPTLGRVAGLDALATLFGPGEDAPVFLSAPPVDGPAPYRPPPEVLARRAAEAERSAARAAHRARLRALGLDEEDLEEDAASRLPTARRHVPRRGAPVSVQVERAAPLILETASGQVALGTAAPGAWWTDVRVGDAKGSQRLLVRLATDEPPRELRAERMPTVSAPGGVLALLFGDDDRIEHVVGAGKVGVFVERDGAQLIAVSITWRLRLASPRA